MVLAIAIGAGGKRLFPKGLEFGLSPYYHMEIIFSALQSDIVLMVAPILCTLPYTAAFLDEFNTGYIKMYMMKTHKGDYIKGKVLAAGIAGGLSLVTGIAIACFISYLVYRPMEIAAPEMVSPILKLIKKCLVYLIAGGLWASVGTLLANVSLSKYMAYASPFVIYYVLVILSERYFRNVYVINPKEWLSMNNYWPGDEWGVMLFMIVLTIPVMIIGYMVIQKKIDS
jgi:hypothetical protein